MIPWAAPCNLDKILRQSHGLRDREPRVPYLFCAPRMETIAYLFYFIAVKPQAAGRGGPKSLGVIT